MNMNIYYIYRFLYIYISYFLNLIQQQSAQAAKKRLEQLRIDKQMQPSPPVATPARQGICSTPTPRQILRSPSTAKANETPVHVEESPAQVEETLKERG